MPCHICAVYGDRTWKKYGFFDAFNPETGWVNPDVIGIDVGIALMRCWHPTAFTTGFSRIHSSAQPRPAFQSSPKQHDERFGLGTLRLE